MIYALSLSTFNIILILLFKQYFSNQHHEIFSAGFVVVFPVRVTALSLHLYAYNMLKSGCDVLLKCDSK